MGKRTSYEPGTFSWVDLGTTDREAAKGFYGELFGWEGEDNPMPDGSGSVYSMMTIGGEAVAAIFDQQQEQRDAGIPPAWFSYVTVASADDSAARAKEAGGSVHAGPFDVGEAGRMAVVADPTGAMFGVWQAGDSIGATLVNDPGSLTSNELSTTDVARASEFYESLFGWKVEPIDTGDFPPYWSIGHEAAAGGRNGGIRELAPEQVEAGIPPHWMPYFTVSSIDDAAATVASGGGETVFGPLDLPTGARIAVARDPQGAFFGLFQGEVDD